ncbi:MAG: hypothetical protein JKY88_00905 [Pseudomonadales bacterium]|nr:hypothetical protein [Pseudomonadales bacterium]
MAFHIGCAYFQETPHAFTPDRHRYVVLTNVDAFDSIVVATFSSIKTTPSGRVRKYDKTCLVNPGDHPFVVRPSFIEYRLTDFVIKTRLEENLRTGKIVQLDQDVSTELLDRIIEGAIVSVHTPQDVVAELLN